MSKAVSKTHTLLLLYAERHAVLQIACIYVTNFSLVKILDILSMYFLQLLATELVTDYVSYLFITGTQTSKYTVTVKNYMR